MIVGIGMDVCSVERFERMLERRPGVVERLLNPAERRVPLASQAARFAAKEALAKALGAPVGLIWLDSEVVRLDGGQPQFSLRGTVRDRAEQLGITRVHLSISHDAGLACAYVVCEGVTGESLQPAFAQPAFTQPAFTENRADLTDDRVDAIEGEES